MDARTKSAMKLALPRVAALEPGTELWTTQCGIWLGITREDAKKLLDELARRGLVEPAGDRWVTRA